jgi:DNA-binding transcriptional LysR family regulator
VDPLNLSRLRAFLLVAEELNFTRAAARLHVAQQALSATIARLERDVGVRLFERSTRAVRLTAAGEAMQRRTRRALEELQHGVADARRIERQGRGSLSVGVMAGAALELTDPILAACARELDGCTVGLDPHLYDDASAGLRSGSSDVALLRLPLELRGIAHVPLFSEPRMAILSTRHPLAGRTSLTLADLHGTTVTRPCSPDPIWNDFWSAGCPTTRDVRTLESTFEMVSAGQAISIGAAGWLRFYPHPGLRGVPVVGLPRSEVAIGWRQDDRNPLVQRFVAVALATARAHPSLVRAIEKPAGTVRPAKPRRVA